ncbi:hypothetical protein NRY95_05680 [Xanthomonas campestris pv. phormiicola]|nr:hypothetical protein NRY95_05680 [Xanthomonas campestris pv. phormiicola]
MRRLLAISTDSDPTLIYRPLHDYQYNLPDQSVECHPCIFNEHHAVVTEGQDVPDEIDSTCPVDGIVRAVIYTVTAEEDGKLIHVCDTRSRADGLAVIRRLAFETGHYSRAWEISTGHITEDAMQYLK